MAPIWTVDVVFWNNKKALTFKELITMLQHFGCAETSKLCQLQLLSLLNREMLFAGSFQFFSFRSTHLKWIFYFLGNFAKKAEKSRLSVRDQWHIYDSVHLFFPRQNLAFFTFKSSAFKIFTIYTWVIAAWSIVIISILRSVVISNGLLWIIIVVWLIVTVLILPIVGILWWTIVLRWNVRWTISTAISIPDGCVRFQIVIVRWLFGFGNVWHGNRKIRYSRIQWCVRCQNTRWRFDWIVQLYNTRQMLFQTIRCRISIYNCVYVSWKNKSLNFVAEMKLNWNATEIIMWKIIIAGTIFMYGYFPNQ